ncbi:MAG: hypothetical protein HZC41_23560 [Chloroflexi bacterium]|nr:hypothetical protein [Chloroflexota bacterium]
MVSVWAMTGCLLAGCAPGATPTPPKTLSPPPSPSPGGETLTPAYPWTDEAAVMNGICFEAARDAAGRVFVLRGAGEQIRFYEQADASGLCRQPVTRVPFDFSGGRVLAGLWSAGTGCTARHDVTGITRDDAARTLTIHLRFMTEGDCPYELVRPFWIGLDGVGDYAINLAVTE